MSDDNIITGQCLCGTIEFHLVPPLGTIEHCHCRSCRLSRGVAFVTWTSVPPDRFRYIQGEADVSWYRSSPGVRWGFCRSCGASMFYIADQEGHLDAPKLHHVYVSVGSLTTEVADRPTAHVSYEKRVGWHCVNDELPKFRGKTDERVL